MFLYIELNVFCILVLGYILLQARNVSSELSRHAFRAGTGMTILFVLTDMLWQTGGNGGIAMSIHLLHFLKGSYFVVTSFMCWFWFLYFEARRDREVFKNRKNILMTGMLSAALLFLILLNIFTGVLYHYEADGTYVRGPLFILTYVLSYPYALAAIVRPFRDALHSRSYIDRDELVFLASFPIPTAIAGFFQYFHPQLPLAAPAITLSVLIIFSHTNETRVSLDALTGLNNRRVLFRQTAKLMESFDYTHKLYLIMCDVDDFKDVNDTYGHVEGDKALQRIADALRQPFLETGKRGVLARYGGDEFTIVLPVDYSAEIPAFMKKVEDRLKALNTASGAPYDLKISMGAVAYQESFITVQQFIAAADEELYKVKSKHHAIR